MIEALRQYFTKCPLLEADSSLSVSYLDSEGLSYAIELLPSEEWYRRYVDGGGIKKLTFAFTSRMPYDLASLENSENLSFYLKLVEWLEAQNKERNLPEIEGAIRIEALSQGYLAYGDGKTGVYQIQLQLLYSV